MGASTADWIIRVFVVAALGYFIWKMKRIDSLASKDEVNAVRDELKEECDNCEGSNITTVLEAHRREQKQEAAVYAEEIHTHIREVKTDLGREIGEIKAHNKTIDDRLYALATKKAEAGT